MDNGGCEQRCINSAGSHQCDCFEGYRYNNLRNRCDGKELLSIKMTKSMSVVFITINTNQDWHLDNYTHIHN